jgi:aminomethyltransferase
MEERGIPRHGYEIQDTSGDAIGMVTSGSQSPVLEKGIGLGYVKNEPQFTQPGSPIQIAVRNRTLNATVQNPPLHK